MRLKHKIELIIVLLGIFHFFSAAIFLIMYSETGINAHLTKALWAAALFVINVITIALMETFTNDGSSKI